MKRKHWNIKELDPRCIKLSTKLRLSPILIQILLNRGIDISQIQPFLYPSRLNLNSAYLLPDIKKAVKRIHQAVENNEGIFVVGDYDVDGVTSLAIFHEYLKENTKKFWFYIPHRVHERYGLTKTAIKQAKKEKAKLIVAFDCGTSDNEQIDYANSLGIDVIVVDHHHCKKDLPNAYALVNPKRENSNYPFKELSSGALSFKLLQALKEDMCQDVLDLVALSLVCDVVPLVGENRVLLKEGLKVIRKSKRLAIKALCEASSIRQGNIDVFHIGFVLGPRINASGRVAHAQEALELFLTDNKVKVKELVKKLCEYNKVRKGIEAEILKEAEAVVNRDSFDDHAIVVANEGWHPGVLGIVASRLVDRYYRPAFVISFDDDIGKGSARSIHSVHLMQMLEDASDHLHLYGGHKKAAGIHIHKNQVEDFRERINTFVKENVATKDLIPVLDIDAAVDFKDITMTFIEQIQLLKPFGEGNRQPLFASFNLKKKGDPQKINRGYSVWLSNGKRTFEAIVYDKDILELIGFGDQFDIVYTLDRNAFYNTPKLTIKDLRLAGSEG